VMILFGIGNILLKVRRASLPRPSRAGWITVVLGILAVGAGLVGNAILIKPFNAASLKDAMSRFIQV